MASPQRSQRQWLTRYLTIQTHFDKKLDKLLLEAAQDAEKALKQLQGKPGIGAEVRAAQLKGARAAMGKVLSDLWRQIGNLVRAGRFQVQAEALNASFDWDEVLLKRVYPDPKKRAAMRASLLASADKNVDAMITRVLKSERPLSTKVYRAQALSKGQLDRAINSALARGASVSELTKVAKDFIRPDVAGGVTYAARRLARTEINNAYHAQSIEAQQGKPWVRAMEWHLSKSHRVPDLCNEYARIKEYPVDGVPDKPHPQCFCYVTPKTISPDEFDKLFLAGGYRTWIESNYGA